MNKREKKIKWKNRLDELLDITHVVANEFMTNEENKEFLRLQRAGRKKIMVGIDKNEKLKRT